MKTVIGGIAAVSLVSIVCVRGQIHGDTVLEGGAFSSINQVLSLFESNKLGFLNAVESVRQADVPPEVREDLSWKIIQATAVFRQWDKTLPAISEFQSKFPSSVHADAMEQTRLVCLWERGMAKVREAMLPFQDDGHFNARWSDGTNCLSAFLAESIGRSDYTEFPRRVLREEIWTARMVFGEDVLKEIPADDPASREKFSWLQLRLLKQLEPRQTGRNWQLARDFLEQFPSSINRPRVEIDFAQMSFRIGRQMCLEADADKDEETAKAKRALAKNYFAVQQAIQERTVTNKAAGIDEAEVFDLLEDRLSASYLLKETTALNQQTASLIAASPPGSPPFLLAKVFDGVMAVKQSPEQAAKTFDEVLATGFAGKPGHDRLIILAAKWRIHLALQAGDSQKAGTLTRWIQKSDCPRNLKLAFIKDYASLAETQPLKVQGGAR